MGSRYIISLDQGTTSSRAGIYDRTVGKFISVISKPLEQYYPRPGWVEHDPEAINKDQLEVMGEAVQSAGIRLDDIACIGITNQRETVVIWDRDTGKPVMNAIVWQCRRTAPECERLKEMGLAEKIHKKTGLVIDAYFSGTKIKWILDSDPQIRRKAEAGKLAAGTIDSWLIWNLTAGRRHVTDITNASRTMLFDINKLKWDEELCGDLDIPMQLLPEVVDSSGVTGYMSKDILGREIPISGIAGDQQAALFGQCCFEKGSAKNTYGTGCFILMNTGDKPIYSKNGLITTIGWKIGKEVEYSLEGCVFNAGSVVQWLRDELKLIDDAAQTAVEAGKVDDTGGVYFVPAFTGIGAPYWDMYARGLITGITRGTGRAHIIRAALESIAFQSRDVLEAMMKDSGISLKELKVDGGASVNDFLMQFQADMVDVAVKRPLIIETTALGAAYLAGLGVGIWEDTEEIKADWELGKRFVPKLKRETAEKIYLEWTAAVKRTMT